MRFNSTVPNLHICIPAHVPSCPLTPEETPIHSADQADQALIQILQRASVGREHSDNYKHPSPRTPLSPETMQDCTFNIKFVCWERADDKTKPEHLTTKLGSGNDGTYFDFRCGSKTVVGIPPFETKNILTGKLSRRSYSNLAYDEHKPSEHQQRFTTRPAYASDIQKNIIHRYDQKESMRCEVTYEELQVLANVITDRKKNGIFNLFKEAPNPSPQQKVTRCLTILEVLAELRKQKLNQGNVSDMLQQFYKLNSDTTEAPCIKSAYACSDEIEDSYWACHNRGDFDVNAVG